MWQASKDFFMKYVVAMISSVFIFICVGILVGILLALICPKSWFDTVLDLGFLSANVSSIIAAFIASLAATHTFRTSLRAKSFKLYKKKVDKNTI